MSTNGTTWSKSSKIKIALILIFGLSIMLFTSMVIADEWIPASNSLGEVHRLSTATRLKDGRVLVAGGVRLPSNFNDPLDPDAVIGEAYLFDPNTKIFTSTGPLNQERFYHTATLLLDGRVLIAGGYVGGGPSNVLASAEIYDPTTGVFTVTGSLNSARSGHTATLLTNGPNAGKVLLVSGWPGTGSLDHEAELYDPATGTFSYTTNGMTSQRNGHSATLLGNGDVLITGGVNDAGGGVVLNTSEIYRAATDDFDASMNMSYSREGHTATRLTDTLVLIAGGWDGSGPVGIPELFDTDSFGGAVYPLNFCPLITPRQFHSATFIGGGRVLITGGNNGTSGNAGHWAFRDKDYFLNSSEILTYNDISGECSSVPAPFMITARHAHDAVYLPARQEVLVVGGESNLAEVYDESDTDNDGISNLDETGTYLTDPNNADTDGDGLTDGAEVSIYSTTPTDPDSDDDGYTDFLEILRDSDPNTANIDLKWSNDTFIRRILPGDEVLESVVASYGYKKSNNLTFASPTNFDTFEADVTITEIHSKSAFTRARLAGNFYSVQGEDIYAEVGIQYTNIGLRAFYDIVRCENFECSDFQEIAYDTFAPATLNQVHTLRLSWDEVGNAFTFGLDSSSVNVGAPIIPIADAPPFDKYRMIGTRVGGDPFATDSGGYVRALFDNVQVIDQIEGLILYDSFIGPRIDQDNWLPANEFDWQQWEFVRDIYGGILHSELAQYGANESNHLTFRNSDLITEIGANVSVTNMDHDTIQDGAFPTARVGGVFYNDGTPGMDRSGDILAYLGVGPGNQAYWHITRCLSGDCNNPGEYERPKDENGDELANWAFLEAGVDDYIRLEINWDPALNQFTFTCNNLTDSSSNTATIDAAPDVNGPPTSDFKGVSTRVGGVIPQSSEWGYIAANFENISTTTIVDTDGDGVADLFDAFPDDPTDWADTDGDGYGDNSDNCRDDYNPDQLNFDYPADNEGDVCDRDADNDGFISAYFEGDDCDDLNPLVYPGCSGASGCPCEGVSYTPPASDGCNVRTDCDGDGVVEKNDNCPGLHNDQTDTDQDGVGDACDNCPDWFNEDQNQVTFYKDADQDGYYDGTTIVACPIDEFGTPPDGYAISSSLLDMTIDCNDANPNVNPGVGTEIPNNNLDDDCNSATPDILQDYQIVVQSITADNNEIDYAEWEPTYEGDTASITVTFGVTGLGIPVQEADILAMSIAPPPADDISNPSRHAGQYVNDPGEEGLAIENRSPDFSVDDVTDKTISLTSLDSGGSITVYVSATISLPDGDTLTLSNKPMTFPKDSDNDGIGDFYENLYGDLDPLADSDGDGLASMEEYRGVRWKNMEKVDPNIDNGPYDVLAWVPKGTPELIRTNPDHRDLFVKYKGFDAEYPFAVNNGFDALQIDVHALDEQTALGNNIADDYKIDRAFVILEDSTLGGLSPHITRRSERDWKFQTLGKSNIGEDQDYGAESIIYKKSLAAFFEDKPYFDNNTFIGARANQMGVPDNWEWEDETKYKGNGILDPLSMVEDGDDNGIMGSREDPYVNGWLDGDYPIPIGVTAQPDRAYDLLNIEPPTVNADPIRPGLDVDGDGTDETWDPRFNLSPFDVDSDDNVEINLPVVATSGEADPLYENSKAQVLMLIVSHELGHGVGIGPHTSVSTCNMYNETNNFVRHIFSPDAAALIRIHND